MPFFRYVAIPRSGKKTTLLEDLNAIQYCEALPSDNDDVLILVTDSPNKDSEEKLQLLLKNLQSLESLHMSFGCNDELLNDEGDAHDA
jgi:hypothetical protein